MAQSSPAMTRGLHRQLRSKHKIGHTITATFPMQTMQGFLQCLRSVDSWLTEHIGTLSKKSVTKLVLA